MVQLGAFRQTCGPSIFPLEPNLSFQAFEGFHDAHCCFRILCLVPGKD